MHWSLTFGRLNIVSMAVTEVNLERVRYLLIRHLRSCPRFVTCLRVSVDDEWGALDIGKEGKTSDSGGLNVVFVRKGALQQSHPAK